jgi:hypothetical protein
MKGARQMNKNEALVLGCVMVSVASAGSELNELVPIRTKLPAVFEYCPAETVTTISMSTTRRMRELAETGFRPVALIVWDIGSSELALLVENSISPGMQSRLAEEAAAIFKTALDQVATDPAVAKTPYLN